MAVIAIDGPSGSGKSSVSKAVARALDCRYLDTGAMYRAAAIWVQKQQLALSDAQAVAAAVQQMPLEMGTDPANPTVTLAGQDVTQAIREESVSAVVSAIATNLAVRAEMKRRQQAIIADAVRTSPGIVAEGRDITTVIAPDADVRILLTASPEARLRRRALENVGKADAATVEATKDQVLRRDADDATVSQFLSAAPGVITVDSSDLDYDQTVAAVLSVIAGAAGRPTGHPDSSPQTSTQTSP